MKLEPRLTNCNNQTKKLSKLDQFLFKYNKSFLMQKTFWFDNTWG
jgi:hypothetical protein